MQNAVTQIIDSVPHGLTFDSHFVISQVFKLHWNAYVQFAGSNETISQMHGRIAQLIQASPSAQEVSKIWSENIHGTPSECTLWQRR